MAFGLGFISVPRWGVQLPKVWASDRAGWRQDFAVTFCSAALSWWKAGAQLGMFPRFRACARPLLRRSSSGS